MFYNKKKEDITAYLKQQERNHNYMLYLYFYNIKVTFMYA